jgi:hypothetical protein
MEFCTAFTTIGFVPLKKWAMMALVRAEKTSHSSRCLVVLV